MLHAGSGSFWRNLPVILAVACLAGCGGDTPDPSEEATVSEATVNEARAAAGALGSRLKARLMAAMQEGGPQAAIGVCADEAPQIAREVSKETGFTVGRTALRVRNPENAPDAWETEQLEHFIEAVRAGAVIDELEVAEITQDQGETMFRWAKPIPLGPMCATCHGEAVSPDLLSEIEARYPDDAATGFAIGEVRGMFTVSQ